MNIPTSIAARASGRRVAFRRPDGTVRMEVRNAESDEAEVLIYDVIGWPFIEAQDVVKQLNEITAPRITVRINSPGGSVFDGFAIYNALKRHPAKVRVQVDGIAASAASYIAMAGDEIRMGEGTFLMIHNPQAIVFGEASDMRQVADVLDKIRDEIAAVYVRRSGQDHQVVADWMNEETWFNAEEAVEARLADAAEAEAVEPDNDLATTFNLAAFANAPESLRNRTPRPTTTRDLERLLRDAGCSRKQAQSLIAAGRADALRDAEQKADREALAGALRDLRLLITKE